MGNAVAGLGTIFYRWDASASSGAGAWTAMGDINSLSGPSPTKDTIETTTLDTTGGYKTFIGSLKDPGTVSLSMNFVRATYEQMKDDFESSSTFNYKIALPDAANTIIEFTALVTEIPMDIPIDDKITVSVTLKISGQFTLDSASA